MDVLKTLLVAITLLISGHTAWAEEASGSCRIGSGNDYVEATAYLTESSPRKYMLTVVAANSASSPLVNIHVTVTATNANGATVKLFDGMVFPDNPIPGPGSGVIIKDKSVDLSSALSNLTVSVKNAVCKNSN